MSGTGRNVKPRKNNQGLAIFVAFIGAKAIDLVTEIFVFVLDKGHIVGVVIKVHIVL